MEYITVGESKIPHKLYDAITSGTCVIFAGAGVSMGPPSNYPNFNQLVKDTAGGKIPKESKGKSPEAILGSLADKGISVHEYVANYLKNPHSRPNTLHTGVIKLFSSKDIKIVTTNFDQHFTTAFSEIHGIQPAIYAAPALPIGSNFSGIVHIHGSTINEPNTLVLTDRDFGRAYITEGWAARFLVELYSNYTVLFVGYSHTDTVVSYLARGYRNSSRSLFALTPDENSNQWKRLGIEYIPYPLSDLPPRHQNLPRVIDRLARDIGMVTIDRVALVKQMAIIEPPTIPSEDSDFLKIALRNMTVVRHFIVTATGPMWAKWIADSGLLELILSASGSTDHYVAQLVRWYCQEICLKQPDTALAALAAHKKEPGALFLNEMWQCLEYDEAAEPAVAGRWVVILSSQFNSSKSLRGYTKLLNRMAVSGQIHAAMVLYDEHTRPHLTIRPNIPIPDMETRKFSAEYNIFGDTTSLQKFHSEHVVPKINIWSDHLIDVIPGYLRSVDRLDRAFNNEERQYFGWTFHRSSIPPDEKIRHITGCDILVDGLRDAALWVTKTNQPRSDALISEWISSPVALLRRMGVYLLSNSRETRRDGTLRHASELNLISDISVHQELFYLLKEHAGHCNIREVNAFITHARSHYISSTPNRMEANYRLFNLISWIYNNAKIHQPALKRRINHIKKNHKTFGVGERPDLLQWSPNAHWVGDTVLDVDILHKLSLPNIINELVKLSKSSINGHRSGPGPTLKAYAAKYPLRSLLFLGFLCKRKSLGSTASGECLGYIIRGLCNHIGDNVVFSATCRHITKYKLAKLHPTIIAEYLRHIVQNDNSDRSNAVRLRLLSLCQIASKSLINAIDLPTTSQRSLFETAMVSDAHELISASLSLSIGRSGIDRRRLSALHRITKTLISANNNVGVYARFSALSNAHAYFHTDETWTKLHLLRLLDPSRCADHLAHWQGFIHYNNMSHQLMREVDVYMGKVAQFILQANDANTLMRFLSIVAHYCVVSQRMRYSNTLSDIILENSDADNRAEFYKQIFQHVSDENVNGDKAWIRWLKDNLLERRWGRPVPISAAESNALLSIVVHMDEHFNEAVDILTLLPSPKAEHNHQLHVIEQNAPWKEQPLSSCKLIQWAYSNADTHLWVDPDAKKMLVHIAKTVSDRNAIKSLANTMIECGYYEAELLLTAVPVVV